MLRAPERGVVVVTQITITSQTANRKLKLGHREGAGEQAGRGVASADRLARELAETMAHSNAKTN